MDATLVRNLSDHRGNNLLHVVAGAGDADALAWLCAHFKPQIQDALLDENKRGLTPIVAAIQVRQVQIRFQTRWGSATKDVEFPTWLMEIQPRQPCRVRQTTTNRVAEPNRSLTAPNQSPLKTDSNGLNQVNPRLTISSTTL